MLGHPSRHDFENMVHAKLIANGAISPSDITNTYAIFGDNLTGLRGKTAQQKSKRVETDYVPIPRDFI